MFIIEWLADKAVKAVMMLSFMLDSIIYNLVRISYKVFLNIAEIRLGNENAISSVLKRIYIIIGFFMVFVLAYNLLTYIIDPDKVSKKGGAGDLIKKIITALVVIVATPTLCNELYSIQNTILESNVIQKLLISSEKVPVLATNENGKDKMSAFDLGANLMIANVYSAFLYPNDTENDNSPVANSFDCYTILSDVYSSDKTTTSNEEELSEYCEDYLSVIETGQIAQYSDYILDENYSYLFVISTVAGIILVYFFLSFAVGLASRAAKLLVLELIAPIPALIDIVPNQNGRLSAWAKELSSQFMQVFIFEFVVFGTIWMMTLIPSVAGSLLSSTKTMSETNDIIVIPFTIVFLTFGVLKVAKELPKMICNVLGIKDTGLITNNLGSFFGVGAMVGGGAIAAIRGINQGEGLSKISNAIGGLVGGTVRGTAQGFNVKNRKDMKKAVKTTYTNIEENRALMAQRKNRYGLNKYDKDAGLMANLSTFIGNRYKMAAGRTEDFLSEAADTLGVPGYSDYGRIKNKMETAKRFDQIKDFEDLIHSIDKTSREANAHYKSYSSNKNIESAKSFETYLEDEFRNGNLNEDISQNSAIQRFKFNYLNETEMTNAMNEIRKSVYNDERYADDEVEDEIARRIFDLKKENNEIAEEYIKTLDQIGKDYKDTTLSQAANNLSKTDARVVNKIEDFNKDLSDNIGNELLKDIKPIDVNSDTDIVEQFKAISKTINGDPNYIGEDQERIRKGSLGVYATSDEVINARRREQAKQARKEEKNNK